MLNDDVCSNYIDSHFDLPDLGGVVRHSLFMERTNEGG